MRRMKNRKLKVTILTGDIDEEEDIEEVGDEMEDVEMENGVESDEEEEEEEAEDDEEEEESSEEHVAPVKKPNGVPHFSDSEDSAVDLDDLIDDEASEASNDEPEQAEEESEEKTFHHQRNQNAKTIITLYRKPKISTGSALACLS